MHGLLRHVPALVPGIVFLSGGQSEVQATENLNAINRIGGPVAALVLVRPGAAGSALEAWRGEAANVPAAQAAFLHRARMNSEAVGRAAGAREAEAGLTLTSG